MTICLSWRINKCEPLTIAPQSLREVITLYQSNIDFYISIKVKRADFKINDDDSKTTVKNNFNSCLFLCRQLGKPSITKTIDPTA